ncbi:MAG: hypothetical protein KBD46_01705 [Candidatus Levybacteria bacterium]|nr:hypothetical protein [Candidatus Levybacteria bacterium]
MKVLHLRDTDKPTDFLLRRENLLKAQIIGTEMIPSNMKELQGLIDAYGLRRDDLIIVEGNLPKGVAEACLAQRGIMPHLQTPHLRRILTDAGGIFWGFGKPTLGVLWPKDTIILDT